ncbi:hypothetical protein AV530_011799 [Patagioenas fasciata monilis]|uniref:Uncharacterized protein n=1 Tax=Patagioenas fasciata monilis TaxID=372326 RepID=A0A1V4KLW3_PATFA|nr:hypothetical protein AV530_011799 [Patagioenas fasciata monilis]
MPNSSLEDWGLKMQCHLLEQRNRDQTLWIALLKEHIPVTSPGSSKSVDKRFAFENIGLLVCSLLNAKNLGDTSYIMNSTSNNRSKGRASFEGQKNETIVASFLAKNVSFLGYSCEDKC